MIKTPLRIGRCVRTQSAARLAHERFESLFPLYGALESAINGLFSSRFAVFQLRGTQPMISALNVVMRTIINPAGGDIKNVNCQNARQLRVACGFAAAFAPGYVPLRASRFPVRGALSASITFG
jgi:hypothetical protein